MAKVSSKSTTQIRPANAQSYALAVDTLRSGGLVALPTETVYGLAGDARNDMAVARIYAAKGRPAHNPLIAHVMSPGAAADYAEVPPLAEGLIGRFWPGPLTLVMPRKDGSDVSARAGAGLDTIALRCPDTPWASAFAALGFEGPLFMPSANRSGHVSPTTAAHVAADLGGKVDLIIDAGPCPIGVESTVLCVTDEGAEMLRPGGISLDELQGFDARITQTSEDHAVIAPGMLKSHYAPKAQVRLNVRTPNAGESHLGFGRCFTPPGLNLSPSGDLDVAARHLFDYLRKLDTKSSIAVAPIPHDGIGAAINDRLSRSAAKRGDTGS